MKKTSHFLAASLAAFTFAAALGGCSDDNDRKPTAAEGAAADADRQKSIDNLNIPESQKAAMKAHLGGPPVDDPAAKARAHAESQSGRRN